MHKIFNFMMILQGFKQCLDIHNSQFAVCILDKQSDTLKSFSVATNQDCPQQEYLPHSGNIYNNKLKGRNILLRAFLNLVSVDHGISHQCPTGSIYWVFAYKLKGRKMLFIVAVTTSFFQVFIVFPTGPNRVNLMVFRAAILM